QEINERFNLDEYSPIDGQIIEFCDKFAAYMETYLSIKHGITSQNLEDGYGSIYARYSGFRVAGRDLGRLLDYFRL
ncbi:MAG: HAD family hydrolase, partial [Clostridiales bacterium]|nr:HAD family hydrolase [Clostridiales bacterium]